MNKNTSKILVVFVTFTVLLASCGHDKTHPGYEYAPNMYRSVPYDADKGNPNFSNGMTNQHPAEGSIPRGFEPFHYENNLDEYERAGKELSNPLTRTEVNLQEGKRLFLTRCVQCHGELGRADGAVVVNGKFPPPPAYQSEALKNLPEGKIFFSITYGKNLMGPHGFFLDRDQRWKIVQYIQELQKLPLEAK
jgi:hypothetical protein